MFEPRPRKRKTPYDPPRWSARVYARIAREDIALFKFLLEAHGHLGVMSVLDSHKAVVKVSFSPEMGREMKEFLAEAGQAVKVEVVEPARLAGPRGASATP
jgi:hypothetical protein